LDRLETEQTAVGVDGAYDVVVGDGFWTKALGGCVGQGGGGGFEKVLFLVGV
jgi:hypothetical protein